MGSISKTHKDLDVWQKAMDFVVDIYKLTERFPDSERYGLISQIQRAAISIPSNIAQAYGRNHRTDSRYKEKQPRGGCGIVVKGMQTTKNYRVAVTEIHEPRNIHSGHNSFGLRTQNES